MRCIVYCPTGPVATDCNTNYDPCPPSGVNSGKYSPPPHDYEADSQRAEEAERRAKANALNDEGIAAWNRGDWGIAGEKFQKAYAQNPDDKVILTNLANCRNKQGLVAWENGEWEDSAGHFNSAVLHNPDSQEFKNNLAIAIQKRDQQRKLIEGQRQDNRQWQQAHAQYEQGLLSAEKGDWASAAAHFTSASQIYPAEPAYLKNVSWAKTKQGDEAWDRDGFTAAVPYWKSALETDTENEYARKKMALAEKLQHEEQVNKTAAAHITQAIRDLSDALASTPVSDGLDYGDLKVTSGAFGSEDIKPTVIPASPATIGTNTRAGDQLKSAAAAAASGRDLKENYDTGGSSHAGSLVAIDQGRFSSRVRNDPRMIEALKEISELQSKRSLLNSEREELIRERNLSNDKALMQNISEKLALKEKEYQINLKVISDKEVAVKKLHRKIDNEVVDKPGAISSDKAEHKEPVTKSK